MRTSPLPALVMLLACASQPDLIETGELSLVDETPGIAKPHVHATRDGSGLVTVFGELSTAGSNERDVSGHIDVRVHDANGQVLEQATASIAKQSRAGRYGPAAARFEVVLQRPVPPGATLTVRHSPGGHVDGKPVASQPVQQRS